MLTRCSHDCQREGSLASPAVAESWDGAARGGFLLPGSVARDHRGHCLCCSSVYFGYDAGVDVLGEARLAVAGGLR